MKRLDATVQGRVQGVFFRATTQDRAQSLGITGWVRNRRDRSVHVVAEGEEPQLQQLLQFLHQGPPQARVISVDFTWLDATGEFDDFAVEY